VKIRYSEVVRAILYAPAYVAITNGYFEEQGIEQTLATAQGGDKSMAALLSNAADIALMGPEAAIYVLTSDSPTKARIFCGLTSTDGFMLLGREKVEKFDWNMLKGKEILGFRPGSTPLLFLEAALRQNGIDIVAVHHHMTGTSPTIYFLHYWGTGSVDTLAGAFKAALDQLGKAKASR